MRFLLAPILLLTTAALLIAAEETSATTELTLMIRAFTCLGELRRDGTREPYEGCLIEANDTREKFSRISLLLLPTLASQSVNRLSNARKGPPSLARIVLTGFATCH
jgi:hypothetical protein